MKNSIKIWISVSVFLSILLLPFHFHFFHFYPEIIQSVFGDWIFSFSKWLGWHPVLTDLSSDSIGLYVFFAIIIGVSFPLSYVLSKKWTEKSLTKWTQYTYLLAAYYLALILFKYGLDKMFKVQFNQPEPNLLFTPLGLLEKDILFWSTMGVSRSYNLFMAWMEILPAALLLFKRTRILGGFIATGVLLNVFAINISFDISVKLFSFFLVILALYIAYPGIKVLLDFFLFKRELKTKADQQFQFKSKYYPFIKTFVIACILIESLFPYVQSGNFNDDKAARPFLHGAYEVERISGKNAPKSIQKLKRIFLHRDSYLILQDEKDYMIDFKCSIDQPKKRVYLRDYDGSVETFNYQFNSTDKSLILQSTTKSPDAYAIHCKQIDYKKLPLLQDQFHWSVD